MFVTVLYSYIYNNKQARTVIYIFIIGNKHEVLGSKAQLHGGLGRSPQPPKAIVGLGANPQCLAFFVVFLLKYHILYYFSLNFYKKPLSVFIGSYFRVYSSD